MKANELMIGDWVQYNGVICKIYCIESPFERKDEKFNNQYIVTLLCNGFVDAVADEIEPIPITEEILDINIFKDYTEIREYQFEEAGEKYAFYLKKMYNKEGICDSWGTNIGGVLPSLIFYVHELQHALRLCGLHDLANNFKIKLI